jgi:predicted MFS family arabinose efflux permease
VLLIGKALDRWGLKLAAVAISALGVGGAGLVLTAVNLPVLCIGLCLVGATSGAADVAMNAVAGRAERITGSPVITRAHGIFSALVVAAGLGTGLSATASLPLIVPFFVVAVACLAAGAWLLKTLPQDIPERAVGHVPAESSPPASPHRRLPLLLIGVLGALAFASENAHQSWSAIFAHEELHSGPGLAAVAPAVFAGTVAITRFSIGRLTAARARTVILTGSLAAAAGAVVIAGAPTLLVAALGLALAAGGTAVLFPTLLGVVSLTIDESHRGRATSIVTTVSYVGFLLGPVYVGLWADATGLRGAMLAVAALAVLLFVLAPKLLGLSGCADSSNQGENPDDEHAHPQHSGRTQAGQLRP